MHIRAHTQTLRACVYLDPLLVIFLIQETVYLCVSARKRACMPKNVSWFDCAMSDTTFTCACVCAYAVGIGIFLKHVDVPRSVCVCTYMRPVIDSCVYVCNVCMCEPHVCVYVSIV